MESARGASYPRALATITVQTTTAAHKGLIEELETVPLQYLKDVGETPRREIAQRAETSRSALFPGPWAHSGPQVT